MSKKKKKSWKERQRERQIKQQTAREAYRIQREREVEKKPRKWPKGKILGAVCLLVLIFGIYGAWQYTKPSAISEEPSPQIPTDGAIPSSGQTRTAGVLEGDWFKYDVNFNWTSTDPNATIPISLNETEWTIIAIVGVSGKNVSGQLTTYYKNGTEETVGSYVDIETGEGEKMTMFVVSTDLGEHDTIYTSDEWSSWKINETIVRTYPDGLRDTNHLNITAELSSEESYQSMSLNYYWDKSTGILVELSEVVVTVVHDYVTISSLRSRITDSNVLIVPEFP